VAVVPRGGAAVRGRGPLLARLHAAADHACDAEHASPRRPAPAAVPAPRSPRCPIRAAPAPAAAQSRRRPCSGRRRPAPYHPLLRLAAVQLRAAPARLAVAQPLPAAPSPSRLTVRGRGFLAAPLAPVARRQAAARHHNGLDAGSPAALPPVPAPPAAGRLKGGER